MTAEYLKIRNAPGMTFGRVFPSACSLNDDRMFVFGGCDRTGNALNYAEMISLNDSNRYEWTVLKEMPSKKAATLTVRMENKLVTIGGIRNGIDQLDEVEAYDPEGDTWLSLSKLSAPLQNISHCFRGNKLFIVGGLTVNNASSDQVSCYDMTRDKWAKFPNLPTPRYSPVVHLKNDNQLYVIGGRHERQGVNVAEMLDLRNMQWRTLDSRPSDCTTARAFYGSVVCKSKCFVIGGIVPGETQDAGRMFSKEVDVFDIDTEKWLSAPKMNKSRADLCYSVLNDDTIVVAGGFGGNESGVEYLKLPNEFDLPNLIGGDIEPSSYGNLCWRELDETMNKPHVSSGFCCNDKKAEMFMFGGMDVNGASNYCHRIALSQ